MTKSKTKDHKKLEKNLSKLMSGKRKITLKGKIGYSRIFSFMNL